MLASESPPHNPTAGPLPTVKMDPFFAAADSVRPMIEKYPLEKAAEAYARMMSGDAQYRVVLAME